jgi:glycosyltransferase involved in cell wall biosynthesis
MKLTNARIQQFNTQNTVLVISKYPYKNVAHSYHGVAHYTQRTLQEVAKQTNKRFVVLVEREYGRTVELDADGQILVIPTFDPTLRMFRQLLKRIRTFNNSEVIQVHSEFHTSGELLQMGLTIPFLWMLKLLGKTVHYTAHNVVTDFSFLASHLGKKHSKRFFTTISKILPLYYFFLSTAITTLVVLDESVRQRLLPFVPKHKLFLSPLWITAPATKVSSRKMTLLRKKLGIQKTDKTLICFGFMTKYKGVDWLVDAVHHLNSIQRTRVHLLLAGGRAPSQAGKPHYEQFYRKLEEHAHAHPYIHLTGFLPEDELATHFAVADLAVLPYRGILGASASWAEAMKYGKPFCISKDISAYLKSPDILKAQATIGVAQKEIVFQRNRKQFAKYIMDVIQEPVLKKLTRLSQAVAKLRAPEQLLAQELPKLYAPAYQNSATSVRKTVLQPTQQWLSELFSFSE